MTNQTEEITKPEPVEQPEETPEQRKEAQARAEACYKVIEKILEEHNCVVQTYLTNPEWVGDWGDKLLMSCTYGVRALPAEPEESTE
jgi:membrane-associated HD superfamily phosphohydrolase